MIPAAYLNGGFTGSSSKIDGRVLRVTTLVDFVNAGRDERKFPMGKLEIRASSDTVIVLDIDDTDGNDETVALRLTIDGKMETYSMPWSTWSTTLSFGQVALR